MNKDKRYRGKGNNRSHSNQNYFGPTIERDISFTNSSLLNEIFANYTTLIINNIQRLNFALQAGSPWFESKCAHLKAKTITNQ